MSYEEKIEVILDNRLESGNSLDENFKQVEQVKIWLSCEWQCSDMEMSEFNRLNQLIEYLATVKIADL